MYSEFPKIVLEVHGKVKVLHLEVWSKITYFYSLTLHLKSAWTLFYVLQCSWFFFGELALKSLLTMGMDMHDVL